MYGIEIEVENLPNAPEYPLYVVTEDGSLRNNGKEYVSGILTYKQAVTTFADLTDTLISNGADFNERCGVHIHVDFREKSREDIASFLTKYLAIERTLSAICGISRANSNFCLPLLEADGNKIYYKQYLFEGKTSGVLARCTKYSALNLAPLTTQGSIEFRMLPSDGKVERFNAVIDMLNTIAYGNLSLQEVVEKYSIPHRDMLEAIAFMESLKSDTSNKSRSKELPFMEQHFGYKKQTYGLTAEQVAKYLETI